MSADASRREALRAAAIAAGALAAGGLLRPVTASAQSEDQEALREFLVEAIALEQIAALAYETAAGVNGFEPASQRTFTKLRDQEQAHATALRSALDSLGFDPPDPPDSPEDTGVLDDVEGLDDAAASELKSTLSELGKISKPEEYVKYLTAIEREQRDYYVEFVPGLDSDDLASTCAEIVGNEAQHLVILRREGGEDPAELLSGLESEPSNQG